MMTKERIKLYWELHAEMIQNNEFDNPTYKFCDKCLDIFPLPKSTSGDDHWRWIKPNKKHKAGSWRCKIKDKEARTRQYYGTGSRNTIDGYLLRKYEIVKYRCTNPAHRDFDRYNGKLIMTKEEFIEWGKRTLPIFKKQKKLENLNGERIQLDRIDPEKGYEIGNIQWLLPEEHWEKTGLDNAVAVNQLDLNGNLVKKWDRMVETESEGFSIHNVSNCCTQRNQTHGGFRWEYADEKRTQRGHRVPSELTT
jgi:hypothetical protein